MSQEDFMQSWFHKARSVLLVGLPLALLLTSAALGNQPRLAIGGYDTVAYFTDGTPVPGTAEFQYQWHNITWQFASAAHRDLFTADPERYAAQYDGHCAIGVSVESGHKDTVDPEAWTIVNGKLYISHTKYWSDEWRKNVATNISRADANWPTVKNMPEPE